MVDAAFLFLPFTALLIGTLDIGQFLFMHQALVERARAAARWGAVNNPADTAAITNMVLYNQSAAPSGGTRAYFNLTSSNVSVTRPDAGTPNCRLNIVISGYSFSVFSPFISGTYTGRPVTVSVPLGQYE
jgi:Flp pilus assembly protein TadG